MSGFEEKYKFWLSERAAVQDKYAKWLESVEKQEVKREKEKKSKVPSNATGAVGLALQGAVVSSGAGSADLASGPRDRWCARQNGRELMKVIEAEKVLRPGKSLLMTVESSRFLNSVLF